MIRKIDIHSLISLMLTLLIVSFGLSAQDAAKKRVADYPIDMQFLKRQSKYSLHRTLSNDHMKIELMKVFEAARWAPSCYNHQPWRFIYGLYGTTAWEKLYGLLTEKAQRWVKNAGAIVLVLSNKIYEKKMKPALTHSFDTGMAVAHLLLQASNNGLVAHPMELHEEDKARAAFQVPHNFALEAIIAIGEEAKEGDAIKEFVERDAIVSQRKPVAEFTYEGDFPR
jgi:nitroreductase